VKRREAASSIKLVISNYVSELQRRRIGAGRCEHLKTDGSHQQQASTWICYVRTLIRTQ
jgi:hypothetical protein